MNKPDKITIETSNCLYCKKEFQPKRRWIQIYCCESCRTLACRERKNGLGGTRQTKSRSTSITDLSKVFEQQHQSALNQMFALQNDLLMMKLNFEAFSKGAEKDSDDIKRKITTANENQLLTIKAKYDSIQNDLIQQNLKLQIISSNQSTQQWVTILSGLFGPTIGASIWEKGKELITGNKEESIDDKLDKFMGIIKNLNSNTDGKIDPQPNEKNLK